MRTLCILVSLLLPLVGCKSSEFTSANKEGVKKQEKEELSEAPVEPMGDARPKKKRKKLPPLDKNLGTAPQGSGGDDFDRDIIKDILDLGKLFQDDETITQGCTTPPETKVHLRTNEVRNATPNEIIEYEIYVVDCNNQRLPIDANYILFDINAQVSAATGNVYGIVGGQSGDMQSIQGVDLFGKAGPEYFHSRTDQRISVNTQSKSAILQIGLLGERYSPIGSAEGATGPFEWPTFLRFGNAYPVQQNVRFID